MKRSEAISHAEQYFDSGEFKQTLARRIAVPTESQNDARRRRWSTISIPRCVPPSRQWASIVKR